MHRYIANRNTSIDIKTVMTLFLIFSFSIIPHTQIKLYLIFHIVSVLCYSVKISINYCVGGEE